MRDITIGQYYPADSLLHKLDPRVKLVGTFVFLISLFAGKGLVAYGIATVCLAIVIKMSKVPFQMILKSLKAIIIILLLTVSFNLFLTSGEVIFQLGFLKVTKEGLSVAFFMALRLIYLVVGASLMTLITTPNDLTDGLESIMGPLRKIKVPVHEIAMMMSIALRFIPILTEETDRIMKAQMARGADLDSGNLVQKIKSLIPILVPLFVAAIRRAGDLAMAMEAKCYNGSEGRTKMKPLVYKKEDRMAYVVLVVYLATMIGLAVLASKLGFGF